MYIAKSKISRKDSNNLVLDMMKYNSLQNRFKHLSDTAAKSKFDEIFGRGAFEDFLVKCRNFNEYAPFEKLS